MALLIAAALALAACDEQRACASPGCADVAAQDDAAPSDDAAGADDVAPSDDAAAPTDDAAQAPTTRVAVTFAGTGHGSVHVRGVAARDCTTDCVDTGAPGRAVSVAALDVDESSTLASITGSCASDDPPWSCSVDTATDQSVRVTFNAQSSPAARAVRTLVNTGRASVRSVGRDAAGNTYVLAAITAPFSLGGTALPMGANRAVFKLDPTGAPLWVRGLYLDYDTAPAMAVSAAGDVWLAGHCARGESLGGAALTTTGPCVARWDAAGAHVLSRGWSVGAVLDAVAISPGGGLAVAGGFSGTIAVNAVTLTSRGGADLFALTLDPATGAATWGERFGGASTEDFPVRLAYGADETLYVASTIRQSGVAGPLTVTNGPYSWSGFVLAYDAMHAVVRSRWLDGDNVSVRTLRVTSAGDVLVGGAYRGAARFATTLPTLAGIVPRPIVLRLDASALATRWVRAGSDGEVADVVSASDGGAFALVELAPGGNDWGGGYLLEPSAGVGRAVGLGLVRLGPRGEHVWSMKLADAAQVSLVNDHAPLGLLIDGADALTVAGTFQNALTLPPHTTAVGTALFFADLPR